MSRTCLGYKSFGLPLGLRHNAGPGPGFNPKDLIQDLNLVQDQVQEALGPGSGLGPSSLPGPRPRTIFR